MTMKKHRRIHIAGALWVLLYVAVVIAPVFIMLVGPRPEGRPFLRDFSVAMAFCAMSIIGLQFILTARIPSLKRPFGSDVVYYFHHSVSIVAVALALLHVMVLVVHDVDTVKLLAFWAAPTRARFALAGLLCLLALIFVSIFRRRLGIEYILWRITHGLLAMGAVAFAMTHMQLVGIYLSLPWKRALWAVYSALWVGALAYARIVRPISMKLHPYEVESIREERGNAWTVSLVPIGHSGPRFSPGQFAWITVDRSPFADVEHPFSFSSSAEQNGLFGFTIKALGDFTKRIHNLVPGTRVYLDGPFGAFSMDRRPDAHAFLFIAGGIGITPIMSMLRTMRDRRDRRPCLLIYGARSLEDMTFLEDLDDLKTQLNLEVQLIPSIPSEGWEGPSGRLTKGLLNRLVVPPSRDAGCEVFVCGPLPMMDAVEQHLIDLGIDRRRIHSERFNLA